jgi:hypothetical protein
MHKHGDATWHVFTLVTGRLTLTIEGEAPKGRTIDHVGFEVDNLEAFTRQLQSKGIKLDVPMRELADTGLKYAFITDPNARTSN